MPCTRSSSRSWSSDTKDEMKNEENKFSIEQFEGKGRGIVAKTVIEKGERLFPYIGEIVTKAEGTRREENESTGYRFFYKDGGKSLCVDATEENGTLGRLVNHGGKTANTKMKLQNGELWLISLRKISAGEEILYDYGIRPLPWPKKQTRGFSTADRIVVIKKNGSNGPGFPPE